MANHTSHLLHPHVQTHGLCLSEGVPHIIILNERSQSSLAAIPSSALQSDLLMVVLWLSLDLSLWQPLIEDRAFVPWLVRQPSEQVCKI